MEDVWVKRKRKQTLWIILLCCILLIFVVFFVVWYLTRDARQYKNAIALYEEGSYEASAQLLEEILYYEDAADYLKLVQYDYAVKLRTDEKYEEALKIFQSLDDYQKSRLEVLRCYYELAETARKEDALDQAIAYYALAEGYSNAERLKNDTIYERGHQLFLQGDYVEAEAYFEQLNGDYPYNGGPHFAEFADAVEYLKQLPVAYSTEETIYIGNIPEEYKSMEQLECVLWQNLSYQFAYISYDENEHSLLYAPWYYPGQRIVQAWKDGTPEELAESEKQAYDKALALVEQASAETSSLLERELWLHDWLCENIVYESPDMDVSTEAFIQLRELTCTGALLDGKANCQGYTDAFYVLGTMAGLEVGKVFGEAEGEGHCWNVVTLDGKQYVVDVTFADSLGETEKGCRYIWYNNAHDPDSHSIDGGEHLFPLLAPESDLTYTYYAEASSIFTDLDEAVYYMLKQHKENGDGWTHVVVTDSTITSEDLYDAVGDNMGKAGVWSVRWIEDILLYNGDSYLTIYWE